MRMLEIHRNTDTNKNMNANANANTSAMTSASTRVLPLAAGIKTSIRREDLDLFFCRKDRRARALPFRTLFGSG